MKKNFKAVLQFCIAAAVIGCPAALSVAAQTETPPAPAAPKKLTVPAVKETRLPNGLTVAVVERRSVPIVTVQLVVKRGASIEPLAKAGVANLTAGMLTKGTASRTASQIAEEIEFLGGSISNGAGWNNSFVSVTVTSDKVDSAMAIMSDVALKPQFDEKELTLLKTQTLDSLTYNLKQPGFLANYAATRFSFGEHPAGGTPASLSAITRDDVQKFYSSFYAPDYSVLIFTGDITQAAANSLAEKYFGTWKKPERLPLPKTGDDLRSAAGKVSSPVRRILVVDLPNSGQAAVAYLQPISGLGRSNPLYTTASVLNSVFGGGYSSRLNQEIRIKRGLSYGAGSGFLWRTDAVNFSTRTQTKNESAAEVAELVIAEIGKLSSGTVEEAELVPRKSVLTGSFGRSLETTAGLASALGDLYSFGIPASELNSYITKVNAVGGSDIGGFAKKYLGGGDIVIVGDYAKFSGDLAKRFPAIKVEVISAAKLDLSQDGLQK